MIQRYKLHIFGPAVFMLLVLGLAAWVGMHPKLAPAKPTYVIKLSSASATQEAASGPVTTQPATTAPAVSKPATQPVSSTKVIQPDSTPAASPASTPSPAATPTPVPAGCPAGEVALDSTGVACTSLCHYAQIQANQAEKDYYANRPDTTLYVEEAGNYNQLAAQADAAGNCNDKSLPLPPFTNGLYPPVPQADM